MNVREEINKFSSDDEKPILLWLIDNYHMKSQWGVVAKCKFVPYGHLSYEQNRVWIPTKEGIALYQQRIETNRKRNLKMEKIGCRIAQRLTAALTGFGIDYNTLAKIVYNEMIDVSNEQSIGDWLEMPNGDTYTKSYTVGKGL